MRSFFLFGLLVCAVLATALTGQFDRAEPERVTMAIQVPPTELAPVTTEKTVTTTATTTTSSEADREPDVDAMGNLVQDHLGTTTTTIEPDFKIAAAQPATAEQPPSTQPPAGTQPTTPVATTTTTAPPPPPPAPAPGGPNSEFESQFASLINSYRSGNGLAGLARDGSLDSRARSWSEQMAESGGLSHSNLGSLLPPWSVAAENVGTGGSVGGVFDALAASSGHRANMVGAYTHFGVGVWVDSAGVIWTTHVFAG